MADTGNTVLFLVLACLPFALGFYAFFTGREKLGVALLVLGAFAIRFLMTTLDPFLHGWDERFHALVAKNMMDNPFVPMLRVDPVIPYDYKAWCCNHIWVHKQPLFMWQMAASMKLFGVNEIAMRLPSAILGTIGVWLAYRIGYLWLKDKTVGFVAAALLTLSYYHLELTSGLQSLEHNDLVYQFYVLASLWAYMEYRARLDRPWPWLALMGFFVGCAVLNKWLTGLLVFAGWGTMLLAHAEERANKRNWLHMAFSLAIAVAIFLPWQVYTAYRFPVETAWEQHFNYLHIITPLDHHAGDAWYHVRFMRTHYGIWLLPLLALGTIALLAKGWLKRPFTIEMFVMFVLIYLFFSQVKTKMPAFTFVVSPIGFMVIAYALKELAGGLSRVIDLPWRAVLVALALPVLLLGYRPWTILDYRSARNEERNDKIHNTQIYKRVGQDLPNDYVVFNCKSFEEVDMMFYTAHNAYHWFPEKHVLDSLVMAGHKVAVFDSHGNQTLPDEIRNSPDFLLIKQPLR